MLRVLVCSIATNTALALHVISKHISIDKSGVHQAALNRETGIGFSEKLVTANVCMKEMIEVTLQDARWSSLNV